MTPQAEQIPPPTLRQSNRGRPRGIEGLESQTEKVGVLLLNLGGPETLDDVQPFLFNLFNDDSIIRLPPQVKFLQPVVATIISTLRAPKSSEGYKSIGGGSPLRRITQDQADALAASLQARGLNASVYVGMRYWKPFTEEAIQQIKDDGVKRLVVLPLYPQFSISTSASSLRLFEDMLQGDHELQGLKHTVIASWYWREGYLTAMTNLIEKELHKFSAPEEVEIFFSAHGVPKSYVEEFGDPYKEEIEQCVGMVMDRLKQREVFNRHTLAYQSRVGPVEWLKPYTDDAIRELGQKGTKSMLAVPISFVSEHIETLEEIDVEYRELAEKSGIEHWGRVPALNTDPTFIDDLAELVIEKLPSAQPRPGYITEALNLGPPTGPVGELLDTYDRDRRVLTPPVRMWQFGWTKSAEVLNGRIAMLAVLVMLVLEAATGQGVLGKWLKL